MPTPNVKDVLLKKTKTLPASNTSVYSDGIALGHGTSGQFDAPCEVVITAPALTNAQLGNAATMKYSLQHDTDSAFGGATDLFTDCIVQTGAGSGAAAASKRIRLPTDVKGNIRVKATNSANADASAASMTLELVF